MSDRRPRADSKLKTLPPERQAQIAEYAAAPHTLAQTVAWLKADGLQTSQAALSGFLSWYSLKEQLARNESTVETMLEQLKHSNPELTEAQLFAAGQNYFSMLAIEQRDAKSWKRTQDLRIKAEALKLEEAKFQRETCELFLKWFEDKRAREVAASGASHSEKIAALGQLVFGESWEEES